MNAQLTPNDLLVRKTITVAASRERAFKVFTEQMSTWWPLATHKIGKAAAKEAIIEPRVGGRWFERGEDGSECDWGSVLVWDPPNRLVLAWNLSAEWKFDRAIDTEVEVRFVREGTGTRVELEHRKLQAYGEKAEAMRKAFEAPDAWAGILAQFGAAASAA